jgi:hypothetical protein
MLLTSDGTVTTLLAACTGEPIDTRTMRQAGPASLDQRTAAVVTETLPLGRLAATALGVRQRASEVV